MRFSLVNGGGWAVADFDIRVTVLERIRARLDSHQTFRSPSLLRRSVERGPSRLIQVKRRALAAGKLVPDVDGTGSK
jgi:hypothetical protein